tara:strand:+ start:10906 stop:11394 length:489 start_codon:yes stop_codon:yes gene_type:complete
MFLSWAFKLIAPNLVDVGFAYLKKKCRLIDDDTYKKIRANQTSIELERSNIEIAKLKAHTAEIKQQAKIDIANVDADYLHDRDIRRLNKRRYSDDILRISFYIFWIACFVRPAQPIVLEGVGILAALPWFMQTILIIACINLLGGHALLRMLWFKRGLSAKK